MDYGSLICTPRNPNCTICEIQNYCLGYKQKLQNTIPVKVSKQKLKPKKYTRAYVLMNEKDEILVRTRPSKGMLASMLEVPNDEWVEKKSLLQKDSLVKEIDKNFEKKRNFSYSFSHFDLKTEIYYLKVRKGNFPKQKWLSVSRYSKSQLPTVMKKIVQLVT
jgi:A/G-specific adenine glycosylase